MAVATEKFYIGSESDEEIVCIPKRELQRLHDGLQHLHDENLSMTMVMHKGFHVRVQPLKAPRDVLSKLTIQSLLYYIASFKMSPPLHISVRGDGFIKTTRKTNKINKCGLIEELGRQGELVADRRDSEAHFINTYCLQK